MTLEKYYPCCRTCNKWATDAHLTGKDHLLHGGGSQETFNFPNRLELNASGVKFTKRDDPSTLETSQFLPADYPLPTQTVRSILVTEMPAFAQSFVVDASSSVGVSPNTKLPKKPIVRSGGAMVKALSTSGSLTRMVGREMHSHCEIPNW